MSAPPIPCVWTGKVFEPLPRAHNLAAAHYGVGEVEMLAPVEERSEVSHRHEFAWLHEAWKTLPDSLAEIYPSSEHLRKRSLVEAGYYHETVIDVGTNAGALRVAAYARADDEFAVAVVRGPVVVIRKAKSQSKRAMGAAAFQESKTAILEIVSALIGVTPERLTQARAA